MFRLIRCLNLFHLTLKFFYKFSIVACSLFFFWNNFFWSFSKHCYLRMFDVMTSRWRRFSRASINLFLIRLQNRRSAYDVRALLIDFWRRFANEINENEWIVHAFLFSKFLTMWFENSLRRCAKRFFCIFINWVVVALTLFDCSCDAYQTKLDDIEFNFNIIINIFYIEIKFEINKSILDLMNEAIRFQTNKWLKNITTRHV
jgi:hypothetical protein